MAEVTENMAMTKCEMDKNYTSKGVGNAALTTGKL